MANNLDHLASDLGIRLELEGTEVAVAAYSADILAANRDGGSRVLIENQYGWTGRHHLGQIMTHLADLWAQTVVWKAQDFKTTIIPDAQEHFLTPSPRRNTHLFGGLGLTHISRLRDLPSNPAPDRSVNANTTPAWRLSMLRLSRLSYIWMLAAPLWAPAAWLIPYVIYIDELLSGLGGNFFIRGQLLLPSLMLWTAAVIIHLSLWTLARRADILAITLGLLTIGLPLVVIVFVVWLLMICNPNNLFGCASTKDTTQIAMAISAAMAILSLPAWCAAGVFGIIHVIQERIRRSRHSDP